jgi:RNA polymerase sporulation-specific sigma factor
LIDKIVISELIKYLLPLEKQIIMLRYFEDRTQTEIASLLDISQVQVSRIEKRILKKMRNMLTDKD